jgi:hypothetical protein
VTHLYGYLAARSSHMYLARPTSKSYLANRLVAVNSISALIDFYSFLVAITLQS